jgi:hypothetical protein
MSSYSFSNNPIHIPRKGSFYPRGSVVVGHKGRRRNPLAEEYDTTFAARLFVGLGVLGGKELPIQKLIAATRKFLREPIKVGKTVYNVGEDSSYISQKGVYKYEADGKVYEENSAQVIIAAPRNAINAILIAAKEHPMWNLQNFDAGPTRTSKIKLFLDALEAGNEVHENTDRAPETF